ncbi:hypothetical protein A5765_18795 [Mycolicibacterium celeriflavum]|uniref:BREX-1 system phosphatase PglZ type B n=1 Tax=Mycolicibacterium celeriflavum TaxID=1249101 RepID=UPI0007FC02E0|nr:BREX-1 system phosphatase PglZ type B [Mycolicibacterium celeriflavum]OBG23486.1 hypothetical protein A5765_18795 [Mycolicibacterium celeriflavum]
MSHTVLDALVLSVQGAADYNQNAHVAPVAVLWPDEARSWEAVVDRLGERVPVISLGEFDVERRRGPAYWLRCVVAGTYELSLPDGVPIVYLPGVGRNSLRAVDACPPQLRPIAELQYRSQWFSHPSSRDWTPRTLLTHETRGLGLAIAEDAETVSALRLALQLLMDEPMDRVRPQFLDAEFFNELVNPDPVRSILDWLDDSSAFRDRLDEARFTAFVQQSKVDLGFDPTSDGEIVAARKLAARSGAWSKVWKRFEDAPERYPGIPAQLRKARPDVLFVENCEAWPQDNEAEEGELRRVFRDFAELTTSEACSRLADLEAEHAWRRGTVWARLDEAPLAFALEHLVILGQIVSVGGAAEDLESLRDDYENRGWRADEAALRALAAATAEPDRTAVSAAVRTIYRPWLEEGARALQKVVGPLANAGTYEPERVTSPPPGVVTVFVDGLRLDIARRVQERLTNIGLEVELRANLAALPTVTHTAKPALVPWAAGLLGPGPELYAADATTGTKATVQVLRAHMQAAGVQVLGPVDKGDPSGVAWTESGELDHRGHDVGARLVDYIDEEVQRIVNRIRELLDLGWQRVEIVTDHGWILLPGGMEKVELPKAVTEVKKGRCAKLKDGAAVDSPTVPWHWDPDVRIALAPGVSCFEAGKEYEHGGVSPQECFVPRITVTSGRSATATDGPEITTVKWLGLLCRIQVDGFAHGVIADIRALPGAANTSIAESVKETQGPGKISLVVPDDRHEGERAFIVLAGSDGQVLAQREVIVGTNR